MRVLFHSFLSFPPSLLLPNWEVVVDDAFDALEVHSASQQVGRNQYPNFAATKLSNNFVTLKNGYFNSEKIFL